MSNKHFTPRSILDTLIKSLDVKLKRSVIGRHEAMMRELTYLNEKKNETLKFIRQHHWTDDRLSVLFALNCLYQEVLGPLAASARGGTAGIGTVNAIVHGSNRFDRAHSRKVLAVVQDFNTLAAELGFHQAWMTKNTCGDLIYWISRHEKDSEN